MTILAIRNISKSFGSVVVAERLNIEVREGEALGVIGPNGAGKTSLFNLISGDLKPDSGTLHLSGADITRMPSRARCKSGIGRTYQIPQPFEQLNVFENVLAGALFGSRLSPGEAERESLGILRDTGLLQRANKLAGGLTLLERKRLELARAMATQPKVLLLDEIAGGLTEAECHELVSTIKSIHTRGVAIVWIEHVVHALLSVVQRLVVLNFGRLVAEGEPKTVMASKEVGSIYLGLEV